MVSSDGRSLTRGLARLIRSLPVEREDRAAAERFVRDWLGCAVAGWNTPAGRILAAATPSPASPDDRLFLAAALSHITETDDLHRSSVTHPACVVIPVALALGRELEADGEAVLWAVLAGYEAMIRVGDALGPAHYRIFHNTATAGVFGAAAAAASLLKLDEDGWVWALGNAGTQGAGLWEFRSDASMSKHLHPGHAALAGVRAARLAAHGFTGPERILEGERGFFRALCPDGDPAAVLAPAPGWRLPETSVKPWPSCRHTHPAIDAALGLREELGDRLSALLAGEDAVQVDTYAEALGLTDAPNPTSTWGAKFSLQFCVAATLLHGSPGLATFEDRLDDPAIRALMRGVRVVEDPALSAAYPGAWSARVRVGGVERLCPAPLGDPERPLSDAAMDGKVLDLLGYGGLTPEEGAHRVALSRAMVDGGMVLPLPLPPGILP
jgi:2-methylcitrate dehydratase PrpD